MKRKKLYKRVFLQDAELKNDALLYLFKTRHKAEI